MSTIRSLVFCVGVTAASSPVAVFAQSGGFEAGMNNWLMQIQQMISAIKVETRQDNASAGQQSSVSRDTEKAAAYSFVETDANYAVNSARQRYESMQTAVAGACADIEANKGTAKAKSNNEDLVAGLSDFEVEWNTNGGRRVEMLSGTQDLRQGPLCPYGEAAMGLCNPDSGDYVSSYRAGDTDAGSFLMTNRDGRRSYGNAEAEVGMVYKDTVAPLATIQSQGDAENEGAAGRTQRLDARHEQALISLARRALDDLILRGLEGGDVDEGE